MGLGCCLQRRLKWHGLVWLCSLEAAVLDLIMQHCGRLKQKLGFDGTTSCSKEVSSRRVTALIESCDDSRTVNMNEGSEDVTAVVEDRHLSGTDACCG